MDPLSVGASVVGLLATAAHVSLVVQGLISRTQNAPQSLVNLKFEVDAIRLALEQLQAFVRRKVNANPSRTALILVDQVTTVLHGCVQTFSELERMVMEFDSDEKMGMMDRIRWLLKSDAIAENLTRIQNHKQTLTLMNLTMLSQSQFEAEQLAERLVVAVNTSLSCNRLLQQRLGILDANASDSGIDPLADVEEVQIDGDAMDIYRKRRALGLFSAFEEDLYKSRVYLRNAIHLDNKSTSSITASGRVQSWSVLSGLSVSDISNIAVIALPLYSGDISNSRRYNFGDESPEDDEESADSAHSENDTRHAFDNAAVRSWRYRRRRDRGPRVFGRPLDEILHFAGVDAAIVNARDKSVHRRNIPIVVVETCRFLEQCDLPTDIFEKFGSPPLRLFDSWVPDGKGLNWDGFTPYDAATCLLVYLDDLPKSIIPSDCYLRCCTVIEEGQLKEITDLDFNSAELPGDGKFNTTFSNLYQILLSLSKSNLDILLYLSSFIYRNSIRCHLSLERLVLRIRPHIFPNKAGNRRLEDSEKNLFCIALIKICATDVLLKRSPSGKFR